jgi:hypothetical protein
MRNKHLKRVVKLLKEAETKEKSKLPGDSIDAQIDKFFVDYESTSMTPKKESYNFRTNTRMLLEAEEDAPVSDTQIDIEEFAASVARLVFNYDSLLEFRDTITKRAHNYLLEKLSSADAKQFLDAMRRNYDVEVGKDIYDEEADLPEPYAVRSGGSGGGGA